MRILLLKHAIAACGALILVACGGGDTRVADGAIGGTGITASGPIAGFGSVFVNGIEFRTSSATPISINHIANRAQSDLGLGWVVTVQGMLNADGMSGIASSIDYSSNIRGLVEDVNLDARTISVLGQTVRVPAGVIIQGFTSLADLTTNEMVEVSGFIDAESSVVATYIEQQGPFVPGVSELRLRGAVANLTQHTFSVGGLSVDYSMVLPQNFPVETLSDGMVVEIGSNSLPQNGVLTATRVRTIDQSLGAVEGNQIVIQGLIANFSAASHFSVSGLPVTISTETVFEHGTTTTLSTDSKVQVRGRWVGAVIAASKISFL